MVHKALILLIRLSRDANIAVIFVVTNKLQYISHYSIGSVVISVKRKKETDPQTHLRPAVSPFFIIIIVNLILDPPTGNSYQLYSAHISPCTILFTLETSDSVSIVLFVAHQTLSVCELTLSW